MLAFFVLLVIAAIALATRYGADSRDARDWTWAIDSRDIVASRH